MAGWPLFELLVAAGAFPCRPLGCNSRWSWGSVREPHRPSRSWMACDAVPPFAMASSMRRVKNWYCDHFLRACRVRVRSARLVVSLTSAAEM